MSFAKPSEDFVYIYNVDPSRKRGHRYHGREALVPPLGTEGNPEWWPPDVANKILRDDNKSDEKTRGWLTMDKKVYEERLEFFEKNGFVFNLIDENVVAYGDVEGVRPGVVKVSDEKLKQLKEKYVAAELPSFLQDEEEKKDSPEKEPEKVAKKESEEEVIEKPENPKRGRPTTRALPT